MYTYTVFVYCGSNYQSLQVISIMYIVHGYMTKVVSYTEFIKNYLNLFINTYALFNKSANIYRPSTMFSSILQVLNIFNKYMPPIILSLPKII